MNYRSLGFLLLFVGLAFIAPAAATERLAAGDSWDFDVYLNEKKVGKHRFSVTETSGGIRKVRSEAEFDYKILFVSAYRYQHSAAERWSGNCLKEFDARTNANGDRIKVSGQQSADGFVVEKDGQPVELPDCVMTFAYWNPDFLEQQRLLNPQTGEYLSVEVERAGEETLKVRGEAVSATRYRVTAEKLDLTLWYSNDDTWLALESVAKGGHIIRYELS